MAIAIGIVYDSSSTYGGGTPRGTGHLPFTLQIPSYIPLYPIIPHYTPLYPMICPITVYTINYIIIRSHYVILCPIKSPLYPPFNHHSITNSSPSRSLAVAVSCCHRSLAPLAASGPMHKPGRCAHRGLWQCNTSKIGKTVFKNVEIHGHLIS